MPSWPATLPKPLLLSWRETRPDNVIRTAMEYGPAKTRRRTLSNVTPVSFELLLSEAQLTTLDDFYDNDVASGALSFSMNHPRTGVLKNYKFTKPFECTLVSSVLIAVSIELEQLS